MSVLSKLSSGTAGVMRRVRRLWLKQRGVHMTGRCWIEAIEIPRNHFDVHLGNGVAIDRGVTLLSTGEQKSLPRITIGSGVYINRYTMIDASERITIGSDCMIGPFCYITDHDHGMAIGVPIKDQTLQGARVEIGIGVWIGAHVTILKGVMIGDGAIVGAGAVVTRNIAANAICAGVPARQIRVRGANLDAISAHPSV